MFGIFRKREASTYIKTDLHSHLLPGIDDGVKSWEESIDIIRCLNGLGIRKIITTPHIISDYYPNTPQIIRGLVEELNTLLKGLQINVEVEAGAEYFLDDSFVTKIDNEEELLCFGNKNILIETPFMNMPLSFFETIFKLRSMGYNPILAHPERYSYLHEDYDLLDKIVDSGTLLQVNASSFVGYYGSVAKKISAEIVCRKLISFIGSDIHNQKHLDMYVKACSSKLYKKCSALNLKNDTL